MTLRLPTRHRSLSSTAARACGYRGAARRRQVRDGAVFSSVSGCPKQKYINTGYPAACMHLQGQSQAMLTPDKPLCNSQHAGQTIESSRSRLAYLGSPAWQTRRSSSQSIRPDRARRSSESIEKRSPQKTKRNLGGRSAVLNAQNPPNVCSAGPLLIAMMAVTVNH